MLKQLPPKFSAIFFPFKENQKLFGATSIMQQLEEHNVEPVKASFYNMTQFVFSRDLKTCFICYCLHSFIYNSSFHARGRLPRKFGLERSIEKRKRGPNVEFCHINRPQKIQLCFFFSFLREIREHRKPQFEILQLLTFYFVHAFK